MRYLIASILCFVLAALALLLMSCSDYQPMPEGEQTNPPVGYIIFCHEHPDSIFCEEVEE